MPAKPKEKQQQPTGCQGGDAYNRNREPHAIGAEVLCYRCKFRMGCTNCVERPAELICLKCHNWASKVGVRRHGNVAVSEKVPSVRTDTGWKYYKRGDESVVDKLEQIVRDL